MTLSDLTGGLFFLASACLLAVVLALANRLKRQRRLALRLADRILAAHEVLAHLAERTDRR